MDTGEQVTQFFGIWLAFAISAHMPHHASTLPFQPTLVQSLHPRSGLTATRAMVTAINFALVHAPWRAIEKPRCDTNHGKNTPPPQSF